MSTEYLNKTEAAAYLDCTPKTLDRYRAAGKLESIERVNASNRKEIAYPLAQLEQLKEKNGITHNPTVEPAGRSGVFDCMPVSYTGAMEAKPNGRVKPEPSLSTVVSANRAQAFELLRTIVDSVAVQIADHELSKPRPAAAIPLDRKLALTIKEAAEYAGVSQVFIRDAIRNGRVVSIKDGRRVRIQRWGLEKYIHAL